MLLRISVDLLRKSRGLYALRPVAFQRLDSNNLLAVYALGVGQHACDLRGIRLRDENNTAQLGLGLVRLGGKDVAHLRLTALKLAAGGLFEAFCSARMGF